MATEITIAEREVIQAIQTLGKATLEQITEMVGLVSPTKYERRIGYVIQRGEYEKVCFAHGVVYRCLRNMTLAGTIKRELETNIESWSLVEGEQDDSSRCGDNGTEHRNE